MRKEKEKKRYNKNIKNILRVPNNIRNLNRIQQLNPMLIMFVFDCFHILFQIHKKLFQSYLSFYYMTIDLMIQL